MWLLPLQGSADQLTDEETINREIMNNDQSTTAVINNSNSTSLLINGWLAEPCIVCSADSEDIVSSHLACDILKKR